MSRLVFFTALSLLLMVTDSRFHVMLPLRASISVLLYPVQIFTTQTLGLARFAGGYFVSLESGQREVADARARLVEQAQRAGQVEELIAENQHLRSLLGLRERMDKTQSAAAQVLYDATDAYSRRVIIDKGQMQGITQGSPVIDESGVLGQVTRVYPFVSEVTLLVDRDQSIPVLSTRTGMRSIAYGDPLTHGGLIELRYVSATEDIKPDDMLTTSGIDGVYPPGLPVARVLTVERQSDSSFSRILCQPLARLSGVTWVLVITPITPMPGADPTAAQLPPMAGASDQALARSARAAAAVPPRLAPSAPAKPQKLPGKPGGSGSHARDEGRHTNAHPGASAGQKDKRR